MLTVLLAKGGSFDFVFHFFGFLQDHRVAVQIRKKRVKRLCEEKVTTCVGGSWGGKSSV